MQCEPNLFKQKLYDEFEQNSYKVLGVPTDRIREVLDEHGEDIDADFIIVSRRLYSDLPLALNHSQNIIYKNNDIFILKKSEPRQFYKI